MVAVGEVIAVGIDIVELIVQPYRLGLLIGLEQRARVPQANVLDGLLVPRQITAGVRSASAG